MSISMPPKGFHWHAGLYEDARVGIADSAVTVTTLSKGWERELVEAASGKDIANEV
jgi:hypothetical protein